MTPYDEANPLSIEAYAKRLENKTLRDLLGSDIEQTYSGKGKLGQLLEEKYFQYYPNSDARADFYQAGVELKTSPLKIINGKLVSKERLVLNIIDFANEPKQTFETSGFWLKNRLLLLMFYLHDVTKIEIDLIFKICRLWNFPEEDLKIIKDDWQKIVGKIRAGLAHELSEGDTLYLGACTKGATAASSYRSQPYSIEPAKQRAYSLKSKYLNFIIDDSLKNQSELAVKSESDYQDGQTFEELIAERFRKFYGKSDLEIMSELSIPSTNAKSKFYLIAKAILGVNSKYIAEFEKANVELKTIRLERNGNLKESMSFKQIQYTEIVNECWENSYWLETLTKRFFFVVFQKDRNGKLRLKKVMFWAMPVSDLEIARKFWEDTRAKILANEFDDFIKASDNRVCHVRPKGRDSDDLMATATGRMVKKKSYWLNAKYIKKIISDN